MRYMLSLVMVAAPVMAQTPEALHAEAVAIYQQCTSEPDVITLTALDAVARTLAIVVGETDLLHPAFLVESAARMVEHCRTAVQSG